MKRFWLTLKIYRLGDIVWIIKKKVCEKHNYLYFEDNKNLATLGDAIIKFVYANVIQWM